MNDKMISFWPSCRALAPIMPLFYNVLMLWHSIIATDSAEGIVDGAENFPPLDVPVPKNDDVHL